MTVDEIDALLPQTQCTRCGFDGCRPYAEAIVSGAAAINRCPPGGESTIALLAQTLGCAVLPLDPECGVEGQDLVAVIDESRCIGCAKCLPPCPVDAIVGARRYMHTVITESCTGCELCLPPCPVDCISMVSRSSLAPVPVEPSASAGASAILAPASAPPPSVNRARFVAHQARAVRRTTERAAVLADKKRAAPRATSA